MQMIPAKKELALLLSFVKIRLLHSFMLEVSCGKLAGGKDTGSPSKVPSTRAPKFCGRR